MNFYSKITIKTRSEEEIRNMDYSKINTLGALKKTGYKPLSIKAEIRKNLIDRLTKKEKVFAVLILQCWDANFVYVFRSKN